MGNITFYHYTNEAGKNAILKEGLIRKSNGATDALFGIGVYGTSLDPSVGRSNIVWNNWDGNANVNTSLMMKASWAIKVQVPESSVKKVPSDRNILIYTGGDLLLVPGFYDAIMVA